MHCGAGGSVGVTPCLLHILSLGFLCSLIFGRFEFAPKHLHWFALKFLRDRQVVLQVHVWVRGGCPALSLDVHQTLTWDVGREVADIT